MKLESKLSDFLNRMKETESNYETLKNSIDSESVHFSFSQGSTCETGCNNKCDCKKTGEADEIFEEN